MAMQRACDIPGYEYFSDMFAVDDVRRLGAVKSPTIRTPVEDMMDLMLGVALASFFADVSRWYAVRLLSEPCVWTEDEDGIHHTACGEMFCFDGPIADHKQRFCGYCGAAIREVRYVEVEP